MVHVGAFMFRKISQLVILVFLLLSLAAAPIRADGASGVVGVRIAAGFEKQFSLADVASETIVIDYCAFSWTVIQASDLPRLDAAGAAYQAFQNPYTLSLGGHTFDPVEESPDFKNSWGEKSSSSEPGLRLLQFHGPTKSEWLNALRADGIDIIQYIHPFTYIVWSESAALENSARHAFVRWTGVFLPAYAVQPANRILSSNPILVRIAFVPQAGVTETIQAVEALGGEWVQTAENADPDFIQASFILPGDRIQNAARLPGVYTVQPVPTDGGDRGEMSSQINAGNYDGSNRAFPGYLSWLSTIGLSGEGVIIANVDSGIDQNHPDIANRMSPCFGLTCGETMASDHGTHTAGIMAGDGTSGIVDSQGFLRGLGMAPGANLIEQAYIKVSEEPDQLRILMRESYLNGAVISGNSWGPSSTPAGYDWDTRLVDIGVRDADPDEIGNQPLTYVLSIMNGHGGTSTQGTPDEAKNIFTIGSTYMQYGDNTRINDLSPNSAHGPALDGRKIPHMVAPGCYVDSSIMFGSYSLKCGTSMASPQVSGAVALFYERYRKNVGRDPSPAMVKAAFLPVAKDLAGNQDADGGILGHPFDSKQGWGRLDAGAVLDPGVDVLYFDQETTFDNTGETWTFTYTADKPIQSLRAMLVWTDAPGHGLGGTAPAWVNDLDLTITTDSQTFFGNNFGTNGLSVPGGSPDFMNNTEGIFLPPSPEGEYRITVTASQISGDGVPNSGDVTDQDFSLALYVSQGKIRYQQIFPLFFY